MDSAEIYAELKRIRDLPLEERPAALEALIVRIEEALPDDSL